MEEQVGTVHSENTSTELRRGILMFKDHVAAMKSGSKLLGGEREDGNTKGHSQKSE